MFKITFVSLFLVFTSSCSLNKKYTEETYVLAKEYSELLKGEITLISKDSDKLHCNQVTFIGVRFEGKINQNLMLNSIGCVITATNEKGTYSIRYICNDKNEKHQLTITLKQVNQVVANFDLSKLL